ncbi:MAG TPA: transcriptional regulator [Corynebacterium sp.]|nr:transcriptional regulator [Corynebacterium sp.]
MSTPHIPRPTTELFPESLNLSPKQREVLNVLQSFPEGARAIEVADQLGMHVNTARGHLDELVSKDAVRVVTAPANGRGRPSLIFRVRIPDNREVAHEYVTLIELLISILAERDSLRPEDLDKAREIGVHWARQMKLTGQTFVGAEDTVDMLYQKLREMGFDPAIRGREQRGSAAEPRAGAGMELALNACPFVTEETKRPSPFICAIHEGFMREALSEAPDESGAVALSLRPFDAPGQCGVILGGPTEGSEPDPGQSAGPV